MALHEENGRALQSGEEPIFMRRRKIEIDKNNGLCGFGSGDLESELRPRPPAQHADLLRKNVRAAFQPVRGRMHRCGRALDLHRIAVRINRGNDQHGITDTSQLASRLHKELGARPVRD